MDAQLHMPTSMPISTGDFLDKGSFKHFVFGEKNNRKLLLIALAGAIFQFVLFKIMYPFPDFISDSYSYIETNLSHMNVNLWPIGYSKYLAFVHFFTPSHFVLILSQYLILEVALLYFFYSFLYFFNLSDRYTNILFIFLFFNPIFLYLSNCVLSDALFCALSLVLFTLYMWMFFKPRWEYVLLQTLIIGVLFTLRYTAIYYPLVGAVAYLLSKQRWGVKIAGIVTPWLLIVPFILYTQQETKKITGTAEFSVFGGWQLANNALYMYDHIKVDSTKLPEGTVELDRMVKEFYKRTPEEQRIFEPFPGTYFIKMPKAVLKPYMFKFSTDFSDGPKQLAAWGKVSPIYNKYGKYLIKEYPFAFAQYYLWLNTKNYFMPHLEKFGSYNIGMDRMLPEAQTWFQLKDAAITAVAPDLQEHIFYFYPIFFMMLNLYFTGSFLQLFFSGNFKNTAYPLYPILLLVVFCLFINFCFSVFATPIVLRYQIFPMIILLGFSLWQTDSFDKSPQKSTND